MSNRFITYRTSAFSTYSRPPDRKNSHHQIKLGEARFFASRLHVARRSTARRNGASSVSAWKDERENKSSPNHSLKTKTTTRALDHEIILFSPPLFSARLSRHGLGNLYKKLSRLGPKCISGIVKVKQLTPYPRRDFRPKALGRSSGPSEVAETAPGVPGDSRWYPRLVRW